VVGLPVERAGGRLEEAFLAVGLDAELDKRVASSIN
jgi:hypothetical protein